MNNNDILFDKIRTEIIKWIEDNKSRFVQERINVEVVHNNRDSYSGVFDFNNCMAEIDINQPDFAPYRYVSFEVVAIVDNVSKLIYSWYDDESTNIEEILFQLNKGIKYATNY